MQVISGPTTREGEREREREGESEREREREKIFTISGEEKIYNLSFLLNLFILKILSTNPTTKLKFTILCIFEQSCYREAI